MEPDRDLTTGDRDELPSLRVVPATKDEAFAYVEKVHRHHDEPQGYKFALAVIDEDHEVRGVCIVGRTVSRHLHDRYSCEVTRVATDGCPNACSALYGAARASAFAMGHTRVYTYTLQSESGASLRAAGYTVDEEDAGGGPWSREGRERNDTHPQEKKVRWVSKRDKDRPRVSWSQLPERPEQELRKFTVRE